MKRDPGYAPRHITADEFLELEPDALGDVEIVDGFVIECMAQSEIHGLVNRRLAAALEAGRDPNGPCLRVSDDVAVRLRDSETGELNVR
ncbi:Uma2 family endonuclease [Thermomonospora umbrina]|uniref:Uma2 family endonuclease n=1 Tax=Thermomonospora umbrina TaxID=111806 RepID=UPI001B879101